MKLIRSKQQEPTTFERLSGYAKLGAHGLTAQRVARRGMRTYRFFRRAVMLAGIGAIAAIVAKRVRGRSGPEASGGYTPPAGGASPGTSAAAAAAAATGTPPVNGARAGADVSDARADAGGEGAGPDTPKEAAAPGLGDEETGGGEKADTAYESAEAGQTPTDSELEVEGPNESTPPPP